MPCLRFFPAAVATVLFAAVASAAPNVVLIMTDDQGYGDLGCHGNTQIRTPHLDRLHGESVRLTNFHVDPTCSPTRSALMTGRYSSRTGVWHTIRGRSLLRSDEVTLAEQFAAGGYYTGIFGKWHLGDNFPSRPQDKGFQEVLVHGGGGITQTPDWWGNTYFNDTLFRNGEPEPQTGYCTDVFFAAAMQFIEDNRRDPFFCYIPTNAPHGPFHVDSRYSQPYVDAGVPQTMANFYGMITNLDENVGRLLAKLDELQLAEKTLVIFMTDNGTAAGYPAGKARPGARGAESGTWTGFNAGMRGTKGSEYEGGHRVPCFWRWKGTLPAGRDLDALAAHIDLLPTLAELCDLPQEEGQPLDGISLAAALRGGETPAGRTLFVHSQRVPEPVEWKNCAVLTDRWRLINGRELYDIQADPGQQTDVAADHSGVVEQLREAYQAWWRSISTRFDEACRIVVGHDAENPSHLTCHDWFADQDPPWSQEAVRRAPHTVGRWMVDVTQTGVYRITLRQQPAVAKFPIDGTTARVLLGPVDLSQPIPAGASEVTLEVDLFAGPGELTATFTDAQGKTRGAYFVEVERVE